MGVVRRPRARPTWQPLGILKRLPKYCGFLLRVPDDTHDNPRLSIVYRGAWAEVRQLQDMPSRESCTVENSLPGPSQVPPGYGPKPHTQRTGRADADAADERGRMKRTSLMIRRTDGGPSGRTDGTDGG